MSRTPLTLRGQWTSSLTQCCWTERVTRGQGTMTRITLHNRPVHSSPVMIMLIFMSFSVFATQTLLCISYIPVPMIFHYRTDYVRTDL